MYIALGFGCMVALAVTAGGTSIPNKRHSSNGQFPDFEDFRVDHHEREDNEDLACSEAEGFVRIPESGNQCVKVFTDVKRTWFEAKKKCEDEGLRLVVKPVDPKAMMLFISKEYGHQHIWLGARGSFNTGLMWVDGSLDESIYCSTYELYYHGVNWITDSHCLILLYSTWTNINPKSRYDFKVCDEHSLNTMCEHIPPVVSSETEVTANKLRDECFNYDESCQQRADAGECITANRGCMLWGCAKACRTCGYNYFIASSWRGTTECEKIREIHHVPFLTNIDECTNNEDCNALHYSRSSVSALYQCSTLQAEPPESFHSFVSFIKKPVHCQGDSGFRGMCFGTQQNLKNYSRCDSLIQNAPGCPEGETCCVDCSQQSDLCDSNWQNSVARNIYDSHNHCCRNERKVGEARPGSGCTCCIHCKPEIECKKKRGRCVTEMDPVLNFQWCNVTKNGTLHAAWCKGDLCSCCIWDRTN